MSSSDFETLQGVMPVHSSFFEDYPYNYYYATRPLRYVVDEALEHRTTN